MAEKVVGYPGVSNGKEFFLTGHAFRKNRLKNLRPGQSRLTNLRHMIRRFRLRPMKQVKVEVFLNGQKHHVKTNELGYFTCQVQQPYTVSGWYDYELCFEGKKGSNRAKGEYYVASDHETAVISDIDDTLLVSHSTKLLKKINLLAFRNAHTRKPIPLIKHWYNHISDLNDYEMPQDFFYVSNSEWNLYDFLKDFFQLNNIPKGVFFLRTLKKGLRDLARSGSAGSNHKEDTISWLFEFFPKKNFILVGDNGQKDLDIYHEFCTKYADRVKGVMIRKLSHVKKDHKMEMVENELKDLGIPLKFFH
jgi:phosphatidate phosphatase APP1